MARTEGKRTRRGTCGAAHWLAGLPFPSLVVPPPSPGVSHPPRNSQPVASSTDGSSPEVGIHLGLPSIHPSIQAVHWDICSSFSGYPSPWFSRTHTLYGSRTRVLDTIGYFHIWRYLFTCLAGRPSGRGESGGVRHLKKERWVVSALTNVTGATFPRSAAGGPSGLCLTSYGENKHRRKPPPCRPDAGPPSQTAADGGPASSRHGVVSGVIPAARQPQNVWISQRIDYLSRSITHRDLTLSPRLQHQSNVMIYLPNRKKGGGGWAPVFFQCVLKNEKFRYGQVKASYENSSNIMESSNKLTIVYKNYFKNWEQIADPIAYTLK